LSTVKLANFKLIRAAAASRGFLAAAWLSCVIWTYEFNNKRYLLFKNPRENLTNLRHFGDHDSWLLNAVL